MEGQRFYCQSIFPLDKLLTKTYESYLLGLILEYFLFLDELLSMAYDSHLSGC
jgi:hypothetical protein